MSIADEIIARAKALHQAARLGEAERLYREALEADPRNVEALYLLAAVCDAQERTAEALAGLQHLLEIAPDHAEGHNHLGALLAEQNRLDEAMHHFEAAARLRPGWAEPQANLRRASASNHCRRGMVLAAEGKLAEASQAFRVALSANPNDVAAIGNLGNALKLQGRLDEAAACYRRVLELVPRSAEAHYNLGLLAREQSRWDDAETHLQQAIDLRPAYPEALCELGRTHVERGTPQSAIAWYRRAVELAPQSAGPRFHLAFALLLNGQLAEGWPEYEWRLAWKDIEGEPLAEPRWSGEALAGRTILLRCEQGYGDAVQFIRYAAQVKRQGARVIVECREALALLLARAPGVDAVVIRGAARPPFDCHAPLLSLPDIFGTTLENIPSQVPYLEPDAERLARWKAELGGERLLKVGIAWQGDPAFANDRVRSIRLSHFEPIAGVPGVRLYSLQRTPGREQLAAFIGQWPIVDLADRLQSFDDTAAVMCNLDLVISSDSAPVHLAGALGVPVWVALAHAADWRWLVGRDDSPWYPTMRLFRQSQAGDWPDVFRRIAAQLDQRACARSPSR